MHHLHVVVDPDHNRTLLALCVTLNKDCSKRHYKGESYAS